jgi:hypothetical protein
MQLDGAITYTLWDRLGLEAGYQYWKLTSGHGEDTMYFTDGSHVRFKLNEVEMERMGPYVGLKYRF